MGPIFIQSHCTVFDHGLTAMDVWKKNNISYLSSLHVFLLLRYSPKARFRASSLYLTCLNIGNGLLLVLVGIDSFVLVDHKRDQDKTRSSSVALQDLRSLPVQAYHCGTVSSSADQKLVYYQ